MRMRAQEQTSEEGDEVEEEEGGEVTRTLVEEPMPSTILCIFATSSSPSFPDSIIRPKYGATYSAPAATAVIT